MDREDATFISKTFIIVIVIVGLLIIGGVAATVVMLHAQHDIVNPIIRQNKVDDPDTTIANRKNFHSLLSEIISADQNVQTLLNQLAVCKQTCGNYDTLQNNLIGVEQIRNNAINNYNAQTDNPDVSKDLENWMPKHIDVTSVPANNDQALSFLQQEINDLQTIYNKGI